MSRAIRVGADPSTGHGCFPPRPATAGSTDVIKNQLRAVRVGDSYAIHCCLSCHGGVATSGSENVIINQRKQHRSGDAISCGDTAANGSLDIFPNDLGR